MGEKEIRGTSGCTSSALTQMNCYNTRFFMFHEKGPGELGVKVFWMRERKDPPRGLGVVRSRDW